MCQTMEIVEEKKSRFPGITDSSLFIKICSVSIDIVLQFYALCYTRPLLQVITLQHCPLSDSYYQCNSYIQPQRQRGDSTALRRSLRA